MTLPELVTQYQRLMLRCPDSPQIPMILEEIGAMERDRSNLERLKRVMRNSQGSVGGKAA